MSTSLMKTLGVLVLVGTLGVASCQAYLADPGEVGGRLPAPTEQRS